MAAPTSVTERERKYTLDGGTAVPRLAGRAGVAAQDDPVEKILDASYFDTAGFRLARAGITLRRRAGGHDAGWHLKLPVSADERRELHLPLGQDAHQVPGPLRRLVRAYTLAEPLVPIAHLRTDRFEHRLADADGRTIATLTDDHVRGEAAGETATLDEWRELELELAPDTDPARLADLHEALVAAGARQAEWPSKLRRLIRIPAARQQDDVIVAYLHAQFDALRRADVGARLDAEDSVHRLRVAARKLRNFVDAPLKEELRWLGRRLAPARDAEVAGQRLSARLDEVPAELVYGPVRQFLTRHFAREAEEGRSRALATLKGKRYLKLLRALDALLADPSLSVKKPRKQMRKAARRLKRAEAATHGLSGEELERALHEVRKKAKRARYTADAVKPVYGKKLRKWRKRVKAVQRTLGAHQDTVVGREVLRHLTIAGFGEGQNTFTFGLLYARDEAEARALRARFAGEWRALRKGPRPGWLE